MTSGIYDKDTRCKGKPGNKQCKICLRKREGKDKNVFANPPTEAATGCKYFL